MTKMRIRTRGGEFLAELDTSPLSDELWLSLPYETPLNMWGDEIYFEIPVHSKARGEMTQNLEVGDVAFWPEARALCIFFGSTPLSAENGKPVSAYPVKKIGRLIGDCSALSKSGDGTKISLEKAF